MQLKGKEKRIWKQLTNKKSNENKLRIIKKELIKRAEKEEKSERILLLKDNSDNILLDYDEMNITAKGNDILKKLANDERMITTKNFFLKQVILLLIIMIF